MKLSEQGIAMIKGFEGCRLKAYQCAAGRWTIGWGHTGPEVRKGLVWTQRQCDDAFVVDAEWREAEVSRLVGDSIWCTAREPIALERARFDALVSLVYNIGTGPKGFGGSTLLRLLRDGKTPIEVCAEQFTRWNKAKGKFNPGLLARRTKEMRVFLVGY